MFRGVVKNSKVRTPIGNIEVYDIQENEAVEIHIRPQAIKLKEDRTPVYGIKGTVMASKLIGSFSLVHLSVLDNNNNVPFSL